MLQPPPPHYAANWLEVSDEKILAEILIRELRFGAAGTVEPVLSNELVGKLHREVSNQRHRLSRAHKQPRTDGLSGLWAPSLCSGFRAVMASRTGEESLVSEALANARSMGEAASRPSIKAPSATTRPQSQAP